MTTVSILPIATADGETTYFAVAGARQSVGKTAGQALDALNAQFREDDAGTLVVVQRRRPDEFFDRDQQRRLEALMARWRAARDRGQELAVADRAELDALVDAELRAAGARIAAMADNLGE